MHFCSLFSAQSGRVQSVCVRADPARKVMWLQIWEHAENQVVSILLFLFFPPALRSGQVQNTYVTFPTQKDDSKLEISPKLFCMTNLSVVISCWNISNQFKQSSSWSFLLSRLPQNHCPWSGFPPSQELLQRAKKSKHLKVIFFFPLKRNTWLGFYAI